MKKFIKDVIVWGLVVGLVMGGLVYVTLSVAGAQVQYDMADMSAKQLLRPVYVSDSMNMDELQGVTYSKGESVDYCGLSPSSACADLYTGDDSVLKVVCGGDTQETMPSTQLQPAIDIMQVL